MLDAGLKCVDTSGVDAAVTENVCESYDISLDFIKSSCEKMSEIVRKDFPCLDVCFFAK